MKKVILALFAATFFFGGKAFAEPIADGPRDPSRMLIWKSTNVAATAGAAVKLSNSAFIHAVVVSSPAAVDFSTAAVLTIYGTQDGTGNVLATIQTSTTEFTNSEVTRYVFDTYASSGMSVIFSTGNASGDQAGSVQIEYQKGPPQNFKVWSSTFFVSDTSTHTLAGGPVLLHKVIVTKAATGTSNMRIYNANTSAPTAGVVVSQIDLTAGDREYDFDCALSSGLTVNIQQNGTVSGEVMFFYKKNYPRDWEVWQTTNVITGTVTTRSLFAGRGVFGGVLNGDNVGTSQITVYDSNGTATIALAELNGSTVYDFDDAKYDCHVSSGLTVTNVGAGQFTVRYKRIR